MKNPKTPINSVWFADDDSDDHQLFTEATRKVLPHASIKFFMNGNDLMARLKPGELPDILFLDLVMPRKDGFECLNEIRQERRLSHLPIVVFSSLSLESHMNASFDLGADIFYKKPSDFAGYVRGLQLLFQLNWQNPSTTTTDLFTINKYTDCDRLY